MSIKEIYKGWEIEKADYGYYEATNNKNKLAFSNIPYSYPTYILNIKTK